MNIVWFYLYEVSRIGKFIEQWLPGLGGKRIEEFLMGTEFLFGVMKKFWKWIIVMVVQHYECI